MCVRMKGGGTDQSRNWASEARFERYHTDKGGTAVDYRAVLASLTTKCVQKLKEEEDPVSPDYWAKAAVSIMREMDSYLSEHIELDQDDDGALEITLAVLDRADVILEEPVGEGVAEAFVRILNRDPN